MATSPLAHVSPESRSHQPWDKAGFDVPEAGSVYETQKERPCVAGFAPTDDYVRELAAGGGEHPRTSASRLVDLTIALSVLIFAAPLMLLIAALVRLQDGGPALFAHPRVGFGGRRFRCFKFRTMVIDAETRLNELLASDPHAYREWVKDHKLRRDPRVTVLGAFLRRSSLDELPQLLNVLRGDMELVGPRPIVEAEIPRYGRFFRHYCQVKPGITGLWQVSGRNNLSYRRRVASDVLYARSKTTMTDISILLRTVPAVLLRSGSF